MGRSPITALLTLTRAPTLIRLEDAEPDQQSLMRLRRIGVAFDLLRGRRRRSRAALTLPLQGFEQ
jgi:hypothetical protein